MKYCLLGDRKQVAIGKLIGALRLWHPFSQSMKFRFEPKRIEKHNSLPTARSVNEFSTKSALHDELLSAESVEVILWKITKSAATTSSAGFVKNEDSTRSSESSYHLVITLSSEETEDTGDELFGLQYLPEDDE